MKPFVLALATLNFVDSISFMIVAPSLAFYINSLGGSQDIYGFILAIYSFMSFCGKPVLGRWSDAYNFSFPFQVSISLAVLGGLFYAIAPAFSTRTALASIALGRIFGGLGKANSALTFAYVARACQASERTSITSVLGSVQMIGMAIAPLFNACLSNVQFSLCGVPFDHLNSVGLLIILFNLISQVVVYLYLPDLPKVKESNDHVDQESEWLRMFWCILQNPHIGVPFMTIFTFNFNFQFIETALAPAAMDALQYGPVQVSYVLGIMAVVVFLGMTTVHALSKHGVSDFKLLVWGLCGNTLGYFMLYMLWHQGVNHFAFAFPIFIASGSFPFLGAPVRSLFTAAVDETPQLSGFEGTMQALLSMAASVGGFTAPSFITHYCLRTPKEVSFSNDGKEFSPIALFSPLLSLAVFGLTYMAGEPQTQVRQDEETVGEKTALVCKGSPKRSTDGDLPICSTSPSHRRCSLQEKARRASCRGSIACSIPFMPQTSDIFDDGE